MFISANRLSKSVRWVREAAGWKGNEAEAGCVGVQSAPKWGAHSLATRALGAAFSQPRGSGCHAGDQCVNGAVNVGIRRHRWRCPRAATAQHDAYECSRSIAKAGVAAITAKTEAEAVALAARVVTLLPGNNLAGPALFEFDAPVDTLDLAKYSAEKAVAALADRPSDGGRPGPARRFALFPDVR